MCGLLAVIGAENAASLVVDGLHWQNHRGQSAAGAVSTDGKRYFPEKNAGLVLQALVPRLPYLHGDIAIGHVRYPTDVAADESAMQPIEGRYGDEAFFLAHNGNVTNKDYLRKRCGVSKTENLSDTALVVKRIEQSHKTGIFEKDLAEALGELRGSFCLLILIGQRVIAVHDPESNHPLSIGKRAGATVVASETCAFDAIGCSFEEDIAAGTFVSIDRSGARSLTRFAPERKKKCPFELVYLGLPTSQIYGLDPITSRLECGRRLEALHPVPGADIVTYVPDSARYLGMGYAESRRSGVYTEGVIRSHYVGRMFIETDAYRDKAMGWKHQAIRSAVAGKSVVLVDDSIVTLRTMQYLVKILREAGAREVHVRVGWIFRHCCHYGIYTPDENKLAGFKWTNEEIAKRINANSVECLELEETLSVLGGEKSEWCTTCVTGERWDLDPQ